jgi:HD superfamily phosphodiesterase
MDKTTNNVLGKMIQYNGTDVRRINHSIKVFTFAQYIGIKENCDSITQSIIEYASILHDIGIHEAEKKYNSSAGKYQEELGSDVAKRLIENLEISDEIKERVYYLIGHHHSYDKIDGIDFQILVEADFIVNIFEDDISDVLSVKDKVFRTKTGIELLGGMYLKNWI